MQRTLTFEGGCNFRDLGGYRTRAGRELQWGRVFRTGVLTYLTAGDQERLIGLGVRTICDLRRAEERKLEPTRWPDANTQHLSWNDGVSPPTIRTIVNKHSHPNTAAGMHAAMIDLYRALPAWMAPRLRDIFSRIAQGEVPVLVHCAAGKDRTGLAIALLLAALDVPQETIVEDYLLTNAYDLAQFIETHQQGETPDEVRFLEMPADIRRALFAADADYLQAALDQIQQDHGGVREYLRREVGVDDAMLLNVRSTLLRADS